MTLFGNTRRKGLFDRRYETPGIGDDIEGQGTLQGLLAPPMSEQPDQAMGKQPGFWAGGDKFTGRDAIAAILAAVGDGFAPGSGAVDMLTGGRESGMEKAKQMAQQRAIMERLVAGGMSPADAAILAGDKTAVREQIGQQYEKPKPPAMKQNYEWWAGLSPQEQQQFSQYQSVVNPKWVTGEDGRPYQMPPAQQYGGLPPGYDPNEWEVIDGPGGAGETQRPFR